jgi:hypothetical protein
MTKAPRRRRIILWTAAIVAAVLVLGSLSLRLYGRHRVVGARARFEQRIGPLDAATGRSPERPETSVAAVLLRVAAAIELDVDQESVVFDLSVRPSREWTDDESRAASGIISRNGKPLREVLDVRRMSIADDTSGSSTHDERLALIRLARLIATQGHLAVPETRAIESVEILGRLAGSLRREPSVSSYLISMYVEGLKLGVVRGIVTARCLDSSELRQLERAIGNDNLRELLRRAFAVDGALDGSSIVEELRTMTTAPIWERYWYTSVADLMLADSLDGAVDLASALSSPYSEVRPTLEAHARRWSLWSGQMSAGFIPNLMSTPGRLAVIAALRDQARLAVALEDHAVTRGEYPTSLAAMPSAEQPSPLTGRRFEYVQTPEGGARLSAPGALEVVERDHILGHYGGNPFVWNLPPPPRR